MQRGKLDIEKIIIHCSATGPNATIEAIRNYHKKVKGWKDIGYHYVIENSGMVRQGRPWQEEGAHCVGHNKDSIGICLVGGHDGKTLHKFSKEQMKSLEILLEGLQLSFGQLEIHGHRDFAAKGCPNFLVKAWLDTGTIVYVN